MNGTKKEAHTLSSYDVYKISNICFWFRGSFKIDTGHQFVYITTLISVDFIFL